MELNQDLFFTTVLLDRLMVTFRHSVDLLLYLNLDLGQIRLTMQDPSPCTLRPTEVTTLRDHPMVSLLLNRLAIMVPIQEDLMAP